MSKYDNSDQRAGAASVKTLSPLSVKIALSVLGALTDSSLYKDYQQSDRQDGFKWTDSDYDKLLAELHQMEKPK